MKPSSTQNQQLQQCVMKLSLLLEEYGEDTFCDAVQNLLDNHPSTEPLANYNYQVIMLPSDYDIEAVLQTATLTAK
ncbi:hypothetical protein ACE1CI_19340 [Aerosakkonemataceae cyanobacterium BLCC-F50]|uniref:Uncharacterized protein n=1 Tax=Floridaenema flaviceps BLCC-F50 TaxID=3153642 RepID=A0ABV4XTS1_9CYAN